MSPFRLLAVATVLSLAAFASAQADWFETGTLTTVIDGEERTLHTYGTYVPEDVADRVEDPQQKAILERVAGTEQHTSTYSFMEGITMGGIALTPDTIWVALTFSFDGHDSSAPHGVVLQFPLDPTTLELMDPEEVEIKYTPDGPSADDYYAFTEGSFELTAVEVVDETTLLISGAYEGYMTRQTGWDIVHDPASALEARGEFTVERVDGSQLALELIQDAP